MRISYSESYEMSRMEKLSEDVTRINMDNPRSFKSSTYYRINYGDVYIFIFLASALPLSMKSDIWQFLWLKLVSINVPSALPWSVKSPLTRLCRYQSVCEKIIKMFLTVQYNITSMARTRMARLPWMIRTLFQSLQNPSNSSRKQIFRDFFSYFIMELYVVCTH